MPAQASALVIVAGFLITSLAGCASFAPYQPGFFQVETATYSVTTQTGLHDTLHVSLSIQAPASLVTAQLVNGRTDDRHIPPMANRSTIVWNVQTGLRERIEQGNASIVPLGVEARLPVAYHPLTLPDLLSAAEIAPVGPQHLLLGDGTAAAITGDWGLIRAEQTASSWWVNATFRCPWDCQPRTNSSAPSDHPWSVRFQGRAGYLLPEVALYSAFETDAWVELRATDHGGEGSIRLERIDAPQPSPVSRQSCGYGPCEGPDWPFPLSLQAGLKALEASMEWRDWVRTARPATLRLAVGETSLTPLNMTDAKLETRQWFLQFVDTRDGSVTIFQLTSIRIAGSDLWTPPRVVGASHDAALIDARPYPPGFPDLVGLDVGAENLAAAFDLHLADVRFIQVLDNPRADSEHRWKYTYWTSERVYCAAGASGQAWYAADRQE